MKLRILFLSANPLDSVRLALDEEAREIREKLRGAAERDQIDFRVRGAARPDDLLHELNEYRPQIVHFSGHGGGEQGIIMSGATGESRLVPGAALRRLFTVLKDDISIVVLNACFSSAQARDISSVIDFVVGMSAEIDEEAARVFSSSFYRALAFGRSVENAFEQGQTAIALHGLISDTVPELLVRNGVIAETTALLARGASTEPEADSSAVSSEPSRLRSLLNLRTSDSEEELGILDYREIFDQRIELMVQIVARMASAMLMLTEKSQAMTRSMNAVTPEAREQLDVSATKQMVNEVAIVLDQVTDSIRADLPSFEAAIDEGIGAMLKITELSEDTMTIPATLQGNKEALFELKNALAGSLDGISSLRNSLSRMPRMTKELI